METLGNGVITMANGALTILGMAASPVAIALVALAGGLAWMALIEVEELDRQGTKPEVGLH